MVDKELIVKSKTELTKDTKKDILSLYSVPETLDRIIEKEKTHLLNNISCGVSFMDSLNKLANSDDFVVDIPKGLREMLKDGKAAFDKSSKSPGSFTPNIRIKGEKGINFQATIVHKSDSQAITQSLSNLAMMAMVQSVFNKLDVLEGKIEDIKKGQKNDRIGNIIGAFKGFIDLYSAFKTEADLKYAASYAYIHMQIGLSQIHQQLNEESKKLDGAPANDWEAFKLSIKPSNFFRNASKQFTKYYTDYIYDIQLYNRLILLADIVLFLKGDTEVIKQNHKVMANYCNEYINDSFKKKMDYLMNNKTTDILNIIDYNNNFEKLLDRILTQGIKIECKSTDLKLLNTDKK